MRPSKLRNILRIDDIDKTILIFETPALGELATLAHPYQNDVILAPAR